RALGDLKIVDVQRKPEGLSKNLRVTKEFIKDREAANSLLLKGFIPVGAEDGSIEIYSSEGEVICGLKDGVEYVLRFGNSTGTLSKEDDKKDGDKKEDGKNEESTGPKVNRFIFVMAQLNKDLIPKPQLEPLPDEAKADAEKADGDETKDEKKEGDKKDAE